MKLRDWLDKEKIRVVSLANFLGVTRCYVYSAMRQQAFSYELSKMITEFTKGEVTIEELRTSKKRKCPECGRMNAKT